MKDLSPARRQAIQREVLAEIVGRLGGSIKVVIPNKPGDFAFITTVQDTLDGNLTVELVRVDRGKKG